MTKSNVELRTINYNDFDFDDDSLNVTGYVNETGRLSELLNDDGQEFVEIMQPGVFTNALATADFVDFYYEHDPEKVLATTQNGSLSLNEDEIGLKMSATIVNTSWGSDAYQMIKSGVIKGMSFGMIVTQDSWDTSGDLPVRTISQIELFEVSAVRFPAYPDSSIESRNIKDRVEARGMNLVKNTKIPKKEVRDVDSESNNNDLVNALNANTQAQTAIADALNSFTYSLNSALNSSEDRSKKSDKPEDKEERSDEEERENENVEEKSAEKESDEKVEAKSKDDSKDKSDESETKSKDQDDSKDNEKEEREDKSKNSDKADEEKRKAFKREADAIRSFFENRLNI